MKVKDLIEALKNKPQEAQVYIYADHGQAAEKVKEPELAYCSNDTRHCIWDEFSYDDGDVEIVII